MKHRGVALLLIISLVMTFATLATIGVGQIVTQARYSHHSMSRVQAYYATQAGVNYAMEMLRIGLPNGWNYNSCPSGSPCSVVFAADDFKPATIVGNAVSIIIYPPNTPGDCPRPQACIEVTADYTLQ